MNMTNQQQHSRYQVIRNNCLKTGRLYLDSEFPPNDTSLYGNKGRSQSLDFDVVEWKRPKEFVKRPKFVVGDITRHDLDQGQIGDCWFIAAAAVLCSPEHKIALQRVISLDQSFEDEYAGVFRFNFWWYGEWVEIIVDDYLPTNGQRLIFCNNRENRDEFWCALLEKAYAKLRGGYASLHGGNTTDALVDLTGGISETIDLKFKHKIPNNLFQLLSKSVSMDTMICASIRRDGNGKNYAMKLDNGLVSGHAYSITNIKQVDTGQGYIRLFRLRNPWGKDEWTGSWSDRSPEMTLLPPRIKHQLTYTEKEDGEFWMSYEDVIQIFDEIQLCHLHPDALSEELEEDGKTTPWKTNIYHGSWISGKTAGGADGDLRWINPQFYITLNDVDDNNNDGKCTLIASLMEKETSKENKISIGYFIHKVLEGNMNRGTISPKDLQLVDSSGAYEYSREVTRRFELTPGVYVIIPTTYSPYQEAEFLLRLYTEKTANSRAIIPEQDIPDKPQREHLSESYISTLFLQKAGMDKSMNHEELRSFIYEISKKEFGEAIEFSLEACRSLVVCMNRNKSGSLDLEETYQMWRELTRYRNLFRHSDSDNSGKINAVELKQMFTKIGFPVSDGLMNSVLKRYGGRQRSLSLDDFVIVICKLILMFEVFQEHREKTRPNGPKDVIQVTMNEFLQYTMFC